MARTGKPTRLADLVIDGGNGVDANGVLKLSGAAAAGTYSYDAGAAATVTPASGKRIIRISAHGTIAGTVVVFGGASTPVPAASSVSFVPNGNLVGDGVSTIVFTNTDSYLVEYLT